MQTLELLVFLHEIEMLLENDLIKGGDLNNAIVYVDKELSDDTMQKLKKAFNKESYYCSTQWYFRQSQFTLGQ